MRSAGNFLDSLALKGLSSVTIAQVRNTANSIIGHDATKGLTIANPFAGVRMTEKARQSEPTYKCSMEEVHSILKALTGNLRAQAAVGLC